MEQPRPEFDQNPEPTPDFEAQCRTITLQWEAGDLPFEEAVDALTVLGREHIAQGQLANQGRIEHLLGVLHHYRGNLNTSIMHYDKARSLYLQLNNPLRVATMDMNQGENFRAKGDFARARRLYRAAYESARQLGVRSLQAMAISNEGLMHISMGDHAKAFAALEEGLSLCHDWERHQDQIPALLCEIHHGLATIYLAQGNIEAAVREAEKSLENAHITQNPLQVGFANRIIGEVLVAMQSAEAQPDDYFRAALSAFGEIQAEGEMAKTMFSQAQAMASRGKIRSAAKLLQQVMIIFTRLGMTYDAARAAEAQLAVT